jgi:hypothetical protein
MSAKQRLRRDHERDPSISRKRSARGGEEGPVAIPELRTAHGAAKDLHLMPKHRVLKLELADASAPTQDPDQPNKKEVDQRQHCVRDASEPR